MFRMMSWNTQSGSCGYLFQGLVLFAVATTLGSCSEKETLLCYKCSVTMERYIVENITYVTPLCSKFKESSEYMVQCPYSTMCLKTISILHLQNGQSQEAITRGCAQQKNTTQVFRNRQWEQEHLVEEVYKEGCTEIKGNNLAGSTNIHCYCRGELCNSSILNSQDKILLNLIILFNVILLQIRFT